MKILKCDNKMLCYAKKIIYIQAWIIKLVVTLAKQI